MGFLSEKTLSETPKPKVYEHHPKANYFQHSRFDAAGYAGSCKTKLPAKQCKCGEFLFAAQTQRSP